MSQSQPDEPVHETPSHPTRPSDDARSRPRDEHPHPADSQIFLFGIVIAGVAGYVLASAAGSADAIRIFGGLLLAVALIFFLLAGVARVLRDHQLWLDSRTSRSESEIPPED